MPRPVSLRIAVIGNCHAQYFGAALATVPGVKVRTVGMAYPGPIGFGGILPKLVHGREVQAWLEAGGPTLVLHQMAPGTRLDLYERITRERPHPLLRFPYVKFDAAVLARPTRADRAADRAYNAAAFAAAGYPLAVLDRLERMVASEPVLFEYNHFSGAVFAVLFQAMIDAGLAEHAPRAALEALQGRMAADRGISHAISPVQQKRWRSPLAGRLSRPAEVWAEVRARDLPDIEAHSLVAEAALRYRRGGRPAQRHHGCCGRGGGRGDADPRGRSARGAHGCDGDLSTRARFHRPGVCGDRGAERERRDDRRGLGARPGSPAPPEEAQHARQPSRRSPGRPRPVDWRPLIFQTGNP